MPDTLPAPLPGLIDHAALEQLVLAGGPEFAHEMVALFRGMAAERLSTVLAGAAAGDRMVVRSAAHSLASSAATVGATALERLGRSVEAYALADRLADALPLLPELSAAAGAAMSALDTVQLDGATVYPSALPLVALLSDDVRERTLVDVALGPTCRVVEVSSMGELVDTVHDLPVRAVVLGAAHAVPGATPVARFPATVPVLSLAGADVGALRDAVVALLGSG
jgi:HPt (histidine-containing phosphotransfer) domain-containing protein